MSSISLNVPTFHVNAIDLHNLIGFVHKHEELLKEFGAIKIIPKADCQLALKKRQQNLSSITPVREIVKKRKDELVYIVKEADHDDKDTVQHAPVTDEHSFWSSLACSHDERRPLNTLVLSNKSCFLQKGSSSNFRIQRLPSQSILKIGGKNLTRQIVPRLNRAFESGAIFPLACAKQHLFSINYHHQGGANHWYIIPSREREILQKIVDQPNSRICLDHGRLLIDPSMLNKNRIRYHHVLQHPNEFIVLAAGTLTQSFAEDANLSESIDFALPSWIEEGHANAYTLPYQCSCSLDDSLQIIDVNLFRDELIQRYITSHLKNTTDDKEPISQNNNNDNAPSTAITTTRYGRKINASKGIDFQNALFTSIVTF